MERGGLHDGPRGLHYRSSRSNIVNDKVSCTNGLPTNQSFSSPAKKSSMNSVSSSNHFGRGCEESGASVDIQLGLLLGTGLCSMTDSLYYSTVSSLEGPMLNPRWPSVRKVSKFVLMRSLASLSGASQSLNAFHSRYLLASCLRSLCFITGL